MARTASGDDLKKAYRKLAHGLPVYAFVYDVAGRSSIFIPGTIAKKRQRGEDYYGTQDKSASS